MLRRSRGLDAFIAAAASCVLAAGCGGPAASEPDDTTPFHMVVIGSSTAAGFGASRDGTAWTDLIHEAMAERAPAAFKLTNLAVGGHTTADLQPGSGVPGNVDDALALAPQLLVVGLGGSNDLSGEMTTERFVAELERVRSAAESAGVPTFFMGTLPKNLTPSDRARLEEWDSAMAARFGSCWIPGDGAHEQCFIGVFDELADPALGLAAEYDSGDGHPNDAGHAVLYEHSLRVIEPYVCATIECRGQPALE
jgi:lysophospholipase L1-like esterase